MKPDLSTLLKVWRNALRAWIAKMFPPNERIPEKSVLAKGARAALEDKSVHFTSPSPLSGPAITAGLPPDVGREIEIDHVSESGATLKDFRNSVGKGKLKGGAKNRFVYENRAAAAAARKSVVMPILDKKRWTRGRWATKAGVGKNSIYGYLDGKRNLTEVNRKAMAETLGLKTEELPD